MQLIKQHLVGYFTHIPQLPVAAPHYLSLASVLDLLPHLPQSVINLWTSPNLWISPNKYCTVIAEDKTERSSISLHVYTYPSSCPVSCAVV